MSLELPIQRTESEPEKMRFQFEGRKVAFRGRGSILQSQERCAQVTEIEMAVAAGQITLEGLSVTTDLL